MKVTLDVDWIDFKHGKQTYCIMGEGHTKLLIIYENGKRTFRIENLEAK